MHDLLVDPRRTGGGRPSPGDARRPPTVPGVPPPEVEVQVLGPVTVVGAARPFGRPWALELVTYLAFHPGGVPSDRWAAALWPDRLVADPTRHSTVSAARRALGRADAGHDHLPRRHGMLALAPSVGTDWDRFCPLARSPEPAAWRAALSLVRGRPFDGLRGGDWTVLEGFAARLEDEIVQAALRLSGHLLAAGDGHGAERAARSGLLASPYDERLYRALLRAADRQGNPAGVESAMAELVRLVGDGTDAAGAAGTDRGRRHGARPPGAGGLAGDLERWVHPETARLYGSLSRRRPAGEPPPPLRQGWAAPARAGLSGVPGC